MLPAPARVGLPGALLLALAACQAPAPHAPSTSATEGDSASPFAEYRADAARGAPVYALDSERSSLRVYVFRGGVAGHLGHNHVLRAEHFEGYVHLPGNDPGKARFDLLVPLAALVIDEPELRAQTGEAFAGERSADDIAGTRANMLGAQSLDVEHFPDVRVHSTAIAGDWPLLVADIELSLHGQTRTMQVPLWVRRDGAGLRIEGRLALRQSDFAVQPFTTLLGLLAVQDTVVVEFDLRATALTSQPAARRRATRAG